LPHFQTSLVFYVLTFKFLEIKRENGYLVARILNLGV